jgi:hypothetical protein
MSHLCFRKKKKLLRIRSFYNHVARAMTFELKKKIYTQISFYYSLMRKSWFVTLKRLYSMLFYFNTSHYIKNVFVSYGSLDFMSQRHCQMSYGDFNPNPTHRREHLKAHDAPLHSVRSRIFF